MSTSLSIHEIGRISSTRPKYVCSSGPNEETKTYVRELTIRDEDLNVVMEIKLFSSKPDKLDIIEPFFC